MLTIFSIWDWWKGIINKKRLKINKRYLFAEDITEWLLIIDGQLYMSLKITNLIFYLYVKNIKLTCSPISAILSAKSFLSSDSMIDLMGVPRILTPYFSNTRFLFISTPQLRAVWPPNVSRIPSGRSDFIT